MYLPVEHDVIPLDRADAFLRDIKLRPPLEPARPGAHISAKTYAKEGGTPLTASSASFQMNAW
jgi:hypothetical protein